MNRLKIIVTIFLTILSSAPLVMPAYFMISRELIRVEMLEKMEKQNLVSVQVPAADFHWYEENKEIIIDGKMFDVKSIILTDGIYHIKGLFDEQETELKLALQNNLEDQEQRDRTAQQLVQFVNASAEFQSPITTPITETSSGSITTGYILPYFPQYCDAVVLPPPEC